jgi:hypothetical protein
MERLYRDDGVGMQRAVDVGKVRRARAARFDDER